MTTALNQAHPEPGADATTGRFVPLLVKAVERLTHDAVTVLFDGDMRFKAGQHLTLRRFVDGQEQRRTYSICASATKPQLRIGVKRLEGGSVSAWINDELQAGDVVEVAAPTGSFSPVLGGDPARRYVAIAAGSGITPILSIVTTTLEVERQSSVVLWCGNKTTQDIMFLEELCDLKDRYTGRFELLFFLSREEHEVALLSGRLDGNRVKRLIAELQPADQVDEWYLCGPFAMVGQLRQTLKEQGVEPSHIHVELFHVDGETPRAVRAVRSVLHSDWKGKTSEVTVLLNGRATTIPVPFDGDPVLDSLRAARSDTPFSCTSGVCGTCRARVVEGSVEMDVAYALEPDETAKGYVLMCQSHPTTEVLRLEVE